MSNDDIAALSTAKTDNSDQLSDHDENPREEEVLSSLNDSDKEKTMIAQPSNAELKEEIQQLKHTLKMLMDSVNMPKPSAEVQESVGTAMQYSAPGTLTTTPAAATSLANIPPTTMPQSPCPPMQQQLHYSEYNMPYHYYTSMPNTAAQQYVPTNATLPSMPTLPTTFVQSQSAQVINTTVPRMTPAASTNLPPQYSNTNFSLPPIAYDSRQLRKLHDLPQFSGQPEQWPMFNVSYKETTRNFKYTNLENLIRLQKSLIGEAKAKVEMFLIHPDSVSQAMNTLEFHYGRPHVLIRSQIAKVRAFPPISGRKMYEIINYSTMVSNLTAFLENAGAAPHLSNPTLLDELVNKLPFTKREEWVKHSVHNLGQYPSVREFSLWLCNVATYISLAAESDAGKNDASCNKKDKMNPTFAITKEYAHTKCVMCSDSHKLFQCNNFKKLSTADRWMIVKRNNLCFYCLRAGHGLLKCQTKRQCGITKCAKFHNKLLHDESRSKQDQNVNKSNTIVNTTDEVNGDGIISKANSNGNGLVHAIVENSCEGKSLFKFLPVGIRGPKGFIRIMAFIDEGSKISLLEEAAAKQIGLNGVLSNLCLGWIGGKTTNENSKKINLEICSSNENSGCFQMKNVWTTKNLDLPPQNLNVENFRSKFPDLNKIKIDDYFEARPKLLIGLPHIRLVRPLNVMNLDECFAVHQTCLGNVLFGSNEESTEATVCKIDVDILHDIDKQVQEYIALDDFGVKNLEPVISHEDQRADEILINTTQKNGKRYETGLLWNEDAYDYIDSYSMAMKRLQALEVKMDKDKVLAEWYKNKIKEYVLKSYARKLSPDEITLKDKRTWYLPHFVITNVNKGNKRRLVFDAAATINGVSFNSRLMKGPIKYQPKPLMSLLFKFRQRNIGVCADIKEMYHQVMIREQDQTAQRFLWREGDATKSPDEYVMQVMIFGSASSPCSAQYVKNINAEAYKETHPEAYRAIVDCHYVDDYVDSFDNIDDALTVSTDVVNIHRQAGFELRGFISNSMEFREAMSKDDFTANLLYSTNLRKGETVSEKVLGMFWSPLEDTFCFKLKFARVPAAVLNGDRRPTKSEVLSITMSIFDPFGFLANVVIRSKILLQELWRYSLDSNSMIPEEVYTKWFQWYQDLNNVEYIRIPRCYHPAFCNHMTTADLHIFVDASEVAFSAVAYWKISSTSSVDVAFVAGKSKCAPIKPLSIPRLELQAAVLGVRLKSAIIANHDVKPGNITFWSDSRTVIKWISSDSRIYKQFISHRISEILDASEVEQWRWVPGSQNPADEATRLHNSMTKHSRWLKGPEFLKCDRSHWPKMPDNISESDCKSEVRSKFVFTIDKPAVIPLEKYSDYWKLLRVICWVKRAVSIFKSFITHKRQHIMEFLTVPEVKNAEIILCKMAQFESFSEEVQQLQLGQFVSKSSSIYKLTPVLDNAGLIRLSGRINNAEGVDSDTKNPIILPRKHLLTKLIVKQYHEDYKHQNQEAICAAVRAKFWIPSIRQAIRAAKANCQICKNISAVPQPPLMGQHPPDRLASYVRPFSYTGVDYMGPFMVSIGRRSEKRWVAIFTCLTVRAIHLEIAKDLSTDAFIMCLRNFVNRRGLPIRIRSDRGTNFIGASKQECFFDETKVANECTRRGVEWIFNPPANPSAGGAWERLVRSVKRVLAFTLNEKAPQVETLNSLLIEAENLINARPLTHLPIDNLASEPLTPNHFLIGGPNAVQTTVVSDNVCLRKQWCILQQLKQTFWKRWVLEYLPELTRRTKWWQPVKPIAVGNVVVICDDNEARGEWKKGVVIEVFSAADGQVRSAVVRTSNGILRRPASKLAVLDVGGESP